MFINYYRFLCRFRRAVWLYLILTGLVGFTYFGVYALILNLYLLRLGYNPAFIGIVNGIGPLALAITSIPAGILIRRWGSRPTLQLGFMLFFSGYLLVPLNEFLPLPARASWLLTTYTLVWLGGTFFIVNTAPFLMAATTDMERTHAFALQGATLPIAGFLGNLIGGMLPGWFALFFHHTLSDPAPYRYALWLAALMILPGIFVASATQPKHTEESVQVAPNTHPIPYRLIVVLTLVMALRTASEFVMRIFFNVYLDEQFHVSTALIGFLGAMGQLLGIIALISPFVVMYIGFVRTIGWGMVGMAFMFLPLLFVTGWWSVGIGFIGLVALNSLVVPAFNLFCQERIEPRWRTTMSSATTLAYGASIAAIAFSGGFFIQMAGYSLLFGMGGLLALCGGGLILLYFRRSRTLL